MQSWSNRSLRVATAALIAILAAWMRMPASAQIVTERNDTIDLTDSLRRDFDSLNVAQAGAILISCFARSLEI